MEPGAGEHAGIPDGLFEQAGATLGSDSWAADVVVKVAPPSADEVRSLHSVFLGGFGAAAGTVAEAEAAVDRTVRSTSAADVAIQLSYARLVVVVPGYGMAVAQAQRAVADLASELEQRGVEVLYASTRWPDGCRGT